MTSDSTLDELEGPGWKDPDYPSARVQRIRALGNGPLRELTSADYRLIISQQRALATLVPLAIELLDDDPLLESEYFPGDLLEAVVGVNAAFWETRPDLHSQARKVLAGAIARMAELDEDDNSDLELRLRQAYERI